MNKLTQEEIKQSIGEKAAAFVEPGMLVGLGTGSTAACFIESLIERCRKEDLKITAVSSSKKSLQQAKAGGINTIDFDQNTELDLTIDGADEVDPQNRIIKGGGGALVREKILATSSKRWIVLVDESKIVPKLGRSPLPIEIIPFGFRATLAKIEKMGYQGRMRIDQNGSYYSTDNGNYIFDIHAKEGFPHPEEDHLKLIQIAGVVETGFFLNLSPHLLIGYGDGNVVFRKDNH